MNWFLNISDMLGFFFDIFAMVTTCCVVCWYVCVQCDDHVCPGGGHLGCPQRAEELRLHPHCCLHNILYNSYIMPRICA